MKIQYDFTYQIEEASATIVVDTDIFKPEDATELLEFFSWYYNKENDPIEELMKKYAMLAIQVATAENYNENGVKDWFAESEGFIPMDGTKGVELVSVVEYVFDSECLYLKKSEL